MNQNLHTHSLLFALIAAGALFSSAALAGPNDIGGHQQNTQSHHDGGQTRDSRDYRQPGNSWQGDARDSHQPDNRDSDQGYGGQQQTERRNNGGIQQQAVARPMPSHRGTIVAQLPTGYRMVHHRDHDYYYVRGHWYRPHGGSFIVVLPPVGLSIPVLPNGYVTLMIGGHPYYRYDDVYYVQRGAQYVVVDAPDSAHSSSAGSDELFIYPARNQTDKQQSQDRYECHQWGSNQTGYDPTQPYGGVAASQSAASRADYQRAMTACLEARGYTVR
ncbi:MAG: DUF6515 family protein [Pseudomonadaceae bacterium]